MAQDAGSSLGQIPATGIEDNLSQDCRDNFCHCIGFAALPNLVCVFVFLNSLDLLCLDALNVLYIAIALHSALRLDSPSPPTLLSFTVVCVLPRPLNFYRSLFKNKSLRDIYCFWLESMGIGGKLLSLHIQRLDIVNVDTYIICKMYLFESYDQRERQIFLSTGLLFQWLQWPGLGWGRPKPENWSFFWISYKGASDSNIGLPSTAFPIIMELDQKPELELEPILHAPSIASGGLSCCATVQAPFPRPPAGHWTRSGKSRDTASTCWI